MKENNIERAKELVVKWNDDTITLEEVKELLMSLSKKKCFENEYLLKRIKQTIDECRTVDVDGHKLLSLLYIDANGNLAASDSGQNQVHFTVDFSGKDNIAGSFSQDKEFAIQIITANGEEICFDVRDDEEFNIRTRIKKKEGLISETEETVICGKTIYIIQRYPLKQGELISPPTSLGWQTRIAKIVGPDRVLKITYKKTKEGDFKTEDRVVWEDNIDSKGNLGEVSFEDLPQQEEIQDCIRQAESGFFITDNISLTGLDENVETVYYNPIYHDQDTLEEMLSREEDETIKEHYRKIFEERASKESFDEISEKPHTSQQEETEELEAEVRRILNSKHFTEEQKSRMIEELYGEFEKDTEQNPEKTGRHFS